MESLTLKPDRDDAAEDEDGAMKGREEAEVGTFACSSPDSLSSAALVQQQQTLHDLDTTPLIGPVSSSAYHDFSFASQEKSSSNTAEWQLQLKQWPPVMPQVTAMMTQHQSLLSAPTMQYTVSAPARFQNQHRQHRQSEEQFEWLW
jgi:hypothetical protein